jgi:hypothetical protein
MLERFSLPALQDVYIGTVAAGCGCGSFPGSLIQKGLILVRLDRDLSEEGVGFGMPALKIGTESIFPGSWEMSAGRYNGLLQFEAEYTMDLVARMAKGESIIKNHLFCLACNTLSRIHREQPELRRKMSNFSGFLRRSLGLLDAFCRISSPGSVRAAYRITGTRIDVTIKFPSIDGCTEKIVLNELGANWFDVYKDSDGLVLKGNEIGSWDEVHATYAAFLDHADGLSFTLKHIEGARMFRGRELVPGRLAWSGLAYVLPPEREEFTYSITIDRT